MKYQSTRNQQSVSAQTAIIRGVAPDGGLYVPTSLPQLAPEKLRDSCYAERATQILSLFFPDFPLANLCQQAYGAKTFRHPQISGLKALDDKTVLLQLIYGKTASFKDYALALYPYLLRHALTSNNATAPTILTATSGDTGKAAMEAVADDPVLSIAVLYPKDGVSTIQKRQMQTQRGARVLPLAINGNFDDAQALVKRYFAQHPNAPITTANSMNIARLLPQIVYYYDAWLRLETTEAIDVVVPSGNFGNALAATLAKRMGLPIRSIIVATNANKVLYDFITTGVYDIRSRVLQPTDAPSMDILVASNLERLLWLLYEDEQKVANWMNQLNTEHVFSLSDQEHALLKETFRAQVTDDDMIRHNIQHLYKEKGILIDPHTAAALPQQPTDHMQLVVSTASPYKFPEAVAQAIGLEVTEDPFQLIAQLQNQTSEVCPPTLATLADQPIRFQQVVTQEAVDETLSTFIQEMHA